MIGFILSAIITGAIVGALARLALPGPDPMGIGETIAIGIGGSLIAGIVFRLLFGATARVNPLGDKPAWAARSDMRSSPPERARRRSTSRDWSGSSGYSANRRRMSADSPAWVSRKRPTAVRRSSSSGALTFRILREF